MTKQKNAIIIYDQQGITRLGVRSLISQIKPSAIVAIVESKEDLIQNLIIHPQSLVILDYTLSDMNSADGLLNINARFQESHWLLFSEELSLLFLRRTVMLNENFSVVLKISTLDEIRLAIIQTLENKQFISHEVTELLKDAEDKEDVHTKEVLTLTEQEILKEIVLGNKTKEIAEKRFISIHTVITHRKNIYRKLKINNAQELMRYAIRAGVIDVSEYQI